MWSLVAVLNLLSIEILTHTFIIVGLQQWAMNHNVARGGECGKIRRFEISNRSTRMHTVKANRATLLPRYLGSAQARGRGY